MRIYCSTIVCIVIVAMLLPTMSQGGNISPDNLFLEVKTDSTEVGVPKSLNQIRFEGWTKEDWNDNEYYRCIRKTLDDYLAGKNDREDLEEYKDIIRSKFVIYSASQYLAGGLFIELVFVDEPSKLFSTSVYSDVDVETEEVTGYEMRGFLLEDVELSFTKEDIRQYLEERPDAKLY